MTAQNVIALSKANEMRRGYLQRKARVKEPKNTAKGFAVLADVLEEDCRWPKSLRVVETLSWPYHSKPSQRWALCERAEVGLFTTVAGMTERQRTALVAALRDPPPKYGHLPPRDEQGRFLKDDVEEGWEQ